MINYSLSRLFTLVLSCSLLLSSLKLAHADSAQEYTVKAAITLNFARFTEWPESALTANATQLNLCVLGDNVVQDAFMQMDSKQVGKRTLKVIYLSRPRNLNECQVLFVSGLDKNIVLQVLNETKSLQVLTVGEESYFVENGGSVSLLTQEAKIEILVNLNATKQAGLALSSRVLNLAKIVQSK